MLSIFFETLPALPLMMTAILIVFGASALQISTGMGFGMVSAPLLVLIDPVFAPIPILMIGLVIASSGAWPERGNIVAAEIWTGFGGRAVGAGLAAGLLLIFTDIKAFMLLFGSLTLIAIAIRVLGRKVAFSLRNHAILSTLSGLMGTITSVGAPPMAILYQGQPPQKTRPTLNALFLISCVTGLAGQQTAGNITPSHFAITLCFLPAALAGIYLARHFKTSSSQVLSVAMLSISALAAIMLIFRGLS